MFDCPLACFASRANVHPIKRIIQRETKLIGSTRRVQLVVQNSCVPCVGAAAGCSGILEFGGFDMKCEHPLSPENTLNMKQKSRK